MNGDRYRWQGEFIRVYQELNKENFTLVACPGSGKTRAALQLARMLMETGQIDYLWIVCPTRKVKEQWAKEARKQHLDIDHKWENGDGEVPGDMSGVAVTYGAVAANPDLYRFNVARKRALVIFDEIHHADDDAAWGDRCKQAFELAARRLLLSGTPWRPRGTIAFASYDADGYVVPDYVPAYGYRQAVMDSVCRPVYFLRTGGQVEWEWRKEIFKHSFDEEVPAHIRAGRLRGAVDADFDKIAPQAESILRDANQKISQLRAEGDTRAGGLVIAKGKDPATGIRHAACIANHIERLFNVEPVLVVSDDKAASDKIEAFRESTSRWLVSINMVSEGVDIPRLRVLAYLTTTTSELYFNQAIGRIDRGLGDAFCFFPDDPLLRDYAERIADERKQALQELEQRAAALAEQSERDADAGFRSLGGAAEDAGMIAMDGDVMFASYRIDRAEYQQAELELAGLWPAAVPHEIVGKFVLAKRRASSSTEQEPPPGGLKSDRKEQLREAQNKIVRRHCVENDAEFAIVNMHLNSEVGIRRLRDATEEQLIRRLRLAQEMTGNDRQSA